MILESKFAIRQIGRLALYFAQDFLRLMLMDLTRLTNEQLDQLLETLPAEIRRREMLEDDAEEAERRKRSVFASFQELAKKQGVSLSDL